MTELKISAQILTLCDHANVREGLLSLLSAGITVLNRASFPAPFGARLAILLGVEGDFPAEGVHLRMSIADRESDERVVPDFEMMFGAHDTPDADADLPGSLPLMLDLEEVAIPRAGAYEIALHVEDALLGTLHFVAVQTIGGETYDVSAPFTPRSADVAVAT